ncbi:MAG: COX15/CtaA family protein [Chloroflexi bacterium]|nr:COX15/CtaA family protein [Chloroflexota bacterium]
MSAGPLESGAGTRPGRSLVLVSFATVIALFALVTMGGVVRVTGSGLGCPDWPLCHGKLIPPLDTPTLIEYSHRLLASVAGLLVLATAVLAWRSHRREPRVMAPATLALVLLVIQVVVGGLAVLGELPPETVTLHLALAEALLASILVVWLVAWRSASLTTGRLVIGSRREPDRILYLGALLFGYILLLSGSYVVGSGATTACVDWPLCQGSLLPVGRLPLVHVAHRFFAAAFGVLVVVTAVTAWRLRPDLRVAAACLAALFAGQVAVGAALVWLRFPAPAQALHLSVATAVWMNLVALTVLAFLTPARRTPSGRVSPKAILEPGKASR